ncbi:slr1659 superfamily regulator [Aphanothece hegewaldii]
MHDNYCIDYDSPTTTIIFKGSLRLSGMEDYSPIANLLEDVALQNKPLITIDLKGLEFLNSSGISMLSKFVINIRKLNKSQLLIKGSDNVPWQGKSLKNLQRLMPSLILEIS